MVFCVIMTNIALSFWCFWLDPVINNDGITYLALAQQVNDGQWQDVFNYYTWPYYSILIAGLASVLSISVETAAYLLNSMLAISLTLAFICIIDDLSHHNRRIVIIATLVILLFPSISKYRAFIIRDFGYLSFYLWSIYFIFRFCQTHSKKHFVAWLSMAAISCLFRFEGVVFLLIAPYFLLLFINQNLRHRRIVLISLSITLLVCTTLLVAWFVSEKYASMIELARKSGKDVHNVIDLFIQNFKDSAGENSDNYYNYALLILKNFSNVAYELIRRMAIFYFIFAIYAYIKKIGITDPTHRKIWLVFVLTNVVCLFAFSFTNSFLVSRYTMASALTLLILAPFVIDQVFRAIPASTWIKRASAILMITVLAAVSVEGLDVRTRKPHFVAAGKWLDNNLPKTATLYSNDRLLVYYANLGAKSNFQDNFSNEQMWARLQTRSIRHYDYVAVSITPNNNYEDILRSTSAYRFGWPIKIFESSEPGRAVFVFKTKR